MAYQKRNNIYRIIRLKEHVNGSINDTRLQQLFRKYSRSFKDIFQNISADDIEKLYSPLHEAHEDKFVDVVNSIIERKTTTTKLQELRKNIGYSQRELAEKSGVNLRTLQQYELKAKDINKAATTTLLSLAKTLGCKIEDLLENV